MPRSPLYLIAERGEREPFPDRAVGFPVYLWHLHPEKVLLAELRVAEERTERVKLADPSVFDQFATACWLRPVVISLFANDASHCPADPSIGSAQTQAVKFARNRRAVIAIGGGRRVVGF